MQFTCRDRSRSRGRHLALTLCFMVLVAGFPVGLPRVAQADHTVDPGNVTIAGNLQSELGCAGDWDPACAITHLTYNVEDDVWQGVWMVPAGAWEFKAAINDSFTENYGLHATANGANIPFSLAAQAPVKFYYDHKSHWVADNQSAVIAIASGGFQSELGCAGDWDPSCLRSWLQDPDGDGIYSFETTAIPPGTYEAKVAINESWDENYGQGGVPNGANIPFTVSAPFSTVRFTYDSSTNVLTISVLQPNLPPVAFDDRFEAQVGTQLVVPAPGVLFNDTDSENQPLSVATPRPISSPANGIVVLNADGSFVYTPTAGFAGVDSFTYRANDGSADSNDATVTIVVGTDGLFDDLYALIRTTPVHESARSAAAIRRAFVLAVMLAEMQANGTQTQRACLNLRLFDTLVRSQVAKRYISPSDAAPLYAESAEIRNKLGCEN